ncbi:MAG TPA: prevent-host-death protein [Kiritimatiellia bacterium]|nr:prevent-host-death protein [Kiritimatiellia bacterium]
MKTLSVGKFKSEFSKILESVAKGNPVAISYGRKHAPVAMMIPYPQKAGERKLGVMEGRAGYAWKEDGKISDEELLRS